MEFVGELFNVGNNAFGILEQLNQVFTDQKYYLVKAIIEQLVEAVNGDIMRANESGIETRPQVASTGLTMSINANLENLFEGHSFVGGVPKMVAKDIFTANKWSAILQFLLDQKTKGGISIGDVKQDGNTLVVEVTTTIAFEHNKYLIDESSIIVASQLRGLMVDNGSDGTPATAICFVFRFYQNQSSGYSLVSIVPIDESQQSDSKLQLALNCLTRHGVIAERKLDRLTFDNDEGWRPVREDEKPQSRIRSPGTQLRFNADKLEMDVIANMMAVLGIDHTYKNESIKIDSVGQSITKVLYGDSYDGYNRSITMPGDVVSCEDGDESNISITMPGDDVSDEGMTSHEIVTPEGW